MTRTYYEARCARCGETFIPEDAEDTEHAAREDGTFCGGEAADMILVSVR